MKLSIYLTTALIWSTSAPLPAAENLDLENETARINYSLGYQIGGDFKRQGVEMDAEAVVQGIHDALSEAEPQIPKPEMRTTLIELKRKVVSTQRKSRLQTEQQNLAEGKEYMRRNANKEGVVTSESGLQYKIIQAGTGKAPAKTDEVTVHYRGTLVNGNVFDSSYDRGKPASFRLDGVIKGWAEGLLKIREGGKIQLVIPPELGYAKRGPLAHQTLLFDVELISVGQGQLNEQSTGKAPAGRQDG